MNTKTFTDTASIIDATGIYEIPLTETIDIMGDTLEDDMTIITIEMLESEEHDDFINAIDPETGDYL